MVTLPPAVALGKLSTVMVELLMAILPQPQLLLSSTLINE
jgi:hypothetical protein